MEFKFINNSTTISINISDNNDITIGINNNNTHSLTKEELYKKLRKDMMKYQEENEINWWYEVWVDFSEDWDDTYDFIKDMSYDEALEKCIEFMYKLDKYYGSDEYIDDLNEMVLNDMLSNLGNSHRLYE